MPASRVMNSSAHERSEQDGVEQQLMQVRPLIAQVRILGEHYNAALADPLGHQEIGCCEAGLILVEQISGDLQLAGIRVGENRTTPFTRGEQPRISRQDVERIRVADRQRRLVLDLDPHANGRASWRERGGLYV